MIIAKTTLLLKATAKLTGIPAKTILLTTRAPQINAARTAIWEILLELGHSRQRIADAFGCDFKTIQWGLDHPTQTSREIAATLRLAAWNAGLQPAPEPKPTAPAIGLRYSR